MDIPKQSIIKYNALPMLVGLGAAYLLFFKERSCPLRTHAKKAPFAIC